MNTNDEMSFI